MRKSTARSLRDELACARNEVAGLRDELARLREGSGQREACLTALLELTRLETRDEEELASFALEACVRLTCSEGGYLHFFDEDQESLRLVSWSRSVRAICQADAVAHYPLSAAGVWADAARLREPVIHNDYPTAPARRGLPEGHFPVHRHASVPVIIGGQVVAIGGVGNKATPYDEGDTTVLTLMLSGAWRIIRHRAAEAARRSLEAQVQHAQKLESLGVLAGGIAHDFNNILTVIRANAELALEELSPAGGAAGLVRDIVTASRQAAGLTGQMLAYSGKGQFEVEELDLAAVASGMESLLRSAVSKKTDLRLDLEPDLPAIRGDADQLRQVILNLVTNASEALPPDGGSVVVRARAVRLEARDLVGLQGSPALEPGAYVEFQVSDTGLGMAPETLARIFEPFFSTKFTGRGLGLAAVLGIVRSHHGGLTLTSAPREGTTFRIVFPALDSRVVAADAVRTPAGCPFAARTMLVVDDDPLVRRAARRALRHLGCEVVTAEDGRRAVELFASDPTRFDGVLLDLTMPGLDGIETLTRLRAVRAGVPVILTSGFSEAGTEARTAGLAVAGFLEKPFDLATLKAMLAEVLPG